MKAEEEKSFCRKRESEEKHVRRSAKVGLDWMHRHGINLCKQDLEQNGLSMSSCFVSVRVDMSRNLLENRELWPPTEDGEERMKKLVLIRLVLASLAWSVCLSVCLSVQGLARFWPH